MGAVSTGEHSRRFRTTTWNGVGVRVPSTSREDTGIAGRMGAVTSDGTMRLRNDQIGAAAELCARAFLNTPHVAYFFPVEPTRMQKTVELFRMRIRYGRLYGDILTTSPDPAGLAVWIPSSKATMTLWRQMRAGGSRLYRAAGSDAVARMTHVAEHNDRLRAKHAPGEHRFLSILAVDPAHQGRGLASRLLESALDRFDCEKIHVYAETTEAELLDFYGRFGFEAGAPSTVSGTDLAVWPLVRPPRMLEQGS